MFKFKLLFIFVLISIVFINPSFLQAQETSSLKEVISSFRVKNLPETIVFNSSTECLRKSEGDANCDNQINLLDLSIWEVELNAKTSFKKSDFNDDGKIDLTDYAIWDKGYNPPAQNPSATTDNGLKSLISSYFKKIQNILVKPLFAQVTPASNRVTDSQTTILQNGSSLITNTNSDGTITQIQLNNGDPLASIIYNTDGQAVSDTTFLSSGDTVTSTIEQGLEVITTKKAAGSVVQSFSQPNGSIATVQSWATLDSYQNNEPPIAATLPTKDYKGRITLNIQANGSGIVRQTDLAGNTVLETQFKPNGTYISRDHKTKTVVESNTGAGLTSIFMENNLGGNTTYSFFRGRLYSVVQTAKNNTSYIAQPLNTEGTSWQFETHLYGRKNSEKVVTNPITEAKGNTPDPAQLIQQINAYTATRLDPATITFADGFTNTANRVSQQIRRADAIYTINQASTTVLGAQTQRGQVLAATTPSVGPVTDMGGGWQQQEYTLADGSVVQINSNGNGVSVSVFDNVGANLAQNQRSSPEVSGSLPSFPGMTEHQATVAAKSYAESVISGTPTGQALDTAVQVGNAAPAQPAAAPPPAAPAPPAAAPPAAGAPPPGPVAAAAAPTFTGQTGTMSLPGGFTSNISVYSDGSQQSIITDSTGQQVATQTSTPQGGSAWSSDSGTTYANHGHFTGYSYQGETGTTYVGIDRSSGDLVASGTAPGTDGYLDGGRTVTQGEYQGFDSRHNHQVDALGAAGSHDYNYNGTTVPGCFLAGTLISTPQGPKAIETLKPGDKVYSYNPVTKQKEIADFKALDINFMKEYLIINQTLKTTTYHPFYKLVNNQLITVKADQLQTGDLLLDENNNVVPIISIKKVKQKVTVYNLLNVSPNNNFYAQGLLVHNYTVDPETGEATEDPDSGDFGEGASPGEEQQQQQQEQEQDQDQGSQGSDQTIDQSSDSNDNQSNDSDQ